MNTSSAVWSGGGGGGGSGAGGGGGGGGGSCDGGGGGGGKYATLEFSQLGMERYILEIRSVVGLTGY